MEKNQKYTSNFSTLSINDVKTKKKKNCFVGTKILNNCQNTTIFTQQAQRPATLLKRDSNAGVFL